MAAAILRVRGLPYSATADDVIEFFKDVAIKGGKRGISFPQGPNGRSNGEAFVELENEDEIETAMGHHNEHMGRRYIEVFRSDESEMKRSMGWQPDRENKKEHVARLRGLPYDTEKRDIYTFFNELQIAPNGIGLLVDHLGRCTGDAYVQFVSAEMLARAKEKHLEKIGRRYIEIFDATGMEANMAIRKQVEINQSRSGSNAGGGPMMSHGPDRYGSPYGRPASPSYRGGGGYGGPPCPPQGGPPGFGRGPRPGPYSRPYGGPGNFNQRPQSPQRGGYGPPSMEKFNSQGGYNQGSDSYNQGGGSYNQGGGSYNQGGGGYNQGCGFNQGGPGNNVGGGGIHSIRMRGLPYSVTHEEIQQFLAPLTPINIHICFNNAGRPSGEADIEFATHDEAKEAMKKDREKIGPRYIELFLESTPMGGGGPPRRQSIPQPSSQQSPGGGGYGGPPRSYGPPFFGGGGSGGNDRGNSSINGINDRFNNNGMPPSQSQCSQGRPSRGGYYDSPNNSSGNMYGSGGGNQDDYGCPPDDRFDNRRDNYGGPSNMGGGGSLPQMEPRRNSGVKVDDGYDYRGERDSIPNDAYYW